jgi:hypothetical protein
MCGLMSLLTFTGIAVNKTIPINGIFINYVITELLLERIRKLHLYWYSKVDLTNEVTNNY